LQQIILQSYMIDRKEISYRGVEIIDE